MRNKGLVSGEVIKTVDKYGCLFFRFFFSSISLGSSPGVVKVQNLSVPHLDAHHYGYESKLAIVTQTSHLQVQQTMECGQIVYYCSRVVQSPKLQVTAVRIQSCLELGEYLRFEPHSLLLEKCQSQVLFGVSGALHKFLLFLVQGLKLHRFHIHFCECKLLGINPEVQMLLSECCPCFPKSSQELCNKRGTPPDIKSWMPQVHLSLCQLQ